MLAVATGADKPACVTNMDCDPGQFCMTRGITTSAAQTKACVMCLCEPPMWDEGWPARSKCGWVYTVGEESEENQRGEEQASARGEYTVVDPTPRALFTNVSAAEFCANQPEHGANPNFAAGCDGCYNPAAHAWSGRSKIEGLRDAVAKMRGGDWLALVVCLMMFGMHHPRPGDVRHPALRHDQPAAAGRKALVAGAGHVDHARWRRAPTRDELAPRLGRPIGGL
jgi:hypothetical protein